MRFAWMFVTGASPATDRPIQRPRRQWETANGTRASASAPEVPLRGIHVPRRRWRVL
jgi:hypothetical protein